MSLSEDIKEVRKGVKELMEPEIEAMPPKVTQQIAGVYSTENGVMLLGDAKLRELFAVYEGKQITLVVGESSEF